MDQVGKFYPMKSKYRHDCSIISSPASQNAATPKIIHVTRIFHEINHPAIGDTAIQWIGFLGKIYGKPSIFPLNMGFSCKCSLKPIHWAIEPPLEILWFPLGKSLGTQQSHGVGLQLRARQQILWTCEVATWPDSKTATGGSWKWSTKWWLMADKWWNVVINGD